MTSPTKPQDKILNDLIRKHDYIYEKGRASMLQDVFKVIDKFVKEKAYDYGLNSLITKELKAMLRSRLK